MNINILHGEEVVSVAGKLVDYYDKPISTQLTVAVKRFIRGASEGNTFMVVCKNNHDAITLWCGYHVDKELKTINIPFVFLLDDLPPLIKGRSLILGISAFFEIAKEYCEYSIFATATPKAALVIDKIISPPFELIGVMKNYFIYNNRTEDAHLFWVPSSFQLETSNRQEV